MNRWIFLFCFSILVSTSAWTQTQKNLKEINSHFEAREKEMEKLAQDKINGLFQEAWDQEQPKESERKARELERNVVNIHDQWVQDQEKLYEHWNHDLLEVVNFHNHNPNQKNILGQITQWYQDSLHFNHKKSKEGQLEVEQRIKALDERFQATIKNPDQTCGEGHEKTIDLKEDGFSMHQVVSRTQKNLANCHSQTAVQLWDAWMKSHGMMGSDFHSSAFMAALLSKKSLENGSTCSVLKKIFTQGSCEEKNTETLTSERLKEYKDWTLGQFNADLEKEFTEFLNENSFFKNPLDFSGKRKKEVVERYSQRLCQSFNDFHLDQVWGVTPDKIKDFLSQGLKTAQVFKQKIFSCPEVALSEKWPKRPGLSCQVANKYLPTEADNRRLLGVIQTQFEKKNPQPLSANICARFMVDGFHTQGLTKNLFEKGNPVLGTLLKKKDDCLSHSVVISGRRNYHGRCQLKVNNSWGKNCQELYHPDLQRHCYQGDFWVDASLLMKNVLDLQWIQQQ